MDQPFNGPSIIKALDTDADGALDFHEFSEAFNTSSSSEREASRLEVKLLYHFVQLDLNGDDLLTASEVEQEP